MQFDVQGTLAKVTIKPAKEGHVVPNAVIQIEVDVTHELGELNFYVDTEVDVTIKPLQKSMDEAILKLKSI